MQTSIGIRKSILASRPLFERNRCYREKRKIEKRTKQEKKKGEKAVNKRRRNEERESGGGKEIELTEEKRRTTDVANERKLVQTRGSREEERERS